MASSPARINDDAPDTQRAPSTRPLDAAEEGEALLRRALCILDGAERMLEALAPSEIQRATARVYLGRAGDDTRVPWALYVARYRTLAGLYESQRSAFAMAARAHLASKGA